MMVPLSWLEQVNTISTLRVLVSFFKKARSTESITFEYAFVDIRKDAGIAANSARNALGELIEKGFIVKIETGAGQTPNSYMLNLDSSKVEPTNLVGSKVDTSKVELTNPLQEWKKSVATRADDTLPKNERQNTSIKDLDLFSYDLYTENINSMSEVNQNIYMTDEELGQLANRVLREIFLPRTVDSRKAPHWFPQQMKLLKDLLVQYRTEQVIAGIVYWTQITDKQKMSSVRFLQFTSKRGSKLMDALDYFKSEYLKRGDSVKVEEKIDRILTRQEEEKIKQEQERARVAAMSDNEFLQGMLGGIKI